MNPPCQAKLAEAAAVLNREPAAITLCYLQTLIEIGVKKNTTIVFPLPIDLLGGLPARLATLTLTLVPNEAGRTQKDAIPTSASRTSSERRIACPALRQRARPATPESPNGEPFGDRTNARILRSDDRAPQINFQDNALRSGLERCWTKDLE